MRAPAARGAGAMGQTVGRWWPSEGHPDRTGDAARRRKEGLIPIEAGEMLVIGDIGDVEVEAHVVIELVAGLELQGGVIVLADRAYAVRDEHRILPAHRRAKLDLLDRLPAKQQVGSGARNIGADGIAVAPFERQVCDAALHGQAGSNAAADFRLDALAAHEDAVVERLTESDVIYCGFGKVRLFGAEQGERAEQGLVGGLALEAGFPALALGRAHGLEVCAEFLLRIEDVAVAT